MASEPLNASNESHPQRKTILVCGMSGAGKSRFINTATGAVLHIGHSINSETSEIASHDTGVPLLTLENCEFELVDTPGFQDTRDTDEVKVFRTLATWCYERYTAKKPITGLIYLKSIQESRVLREETTLMRMLKQLWGEDRLDHVLLITTRWQQPPDREEADREREMVEDPQRFGCSGAEKVMVKRLDGKYTERDTQEALKSFYNVEPATMRIQEEMARGVEPTLTSAGQVIYGTLLERLNQLQDDLKSEQKNTRTLQTELDKVKKRLKELERPWPWPFGKKVPAKPATPATPATPAKPATPATPAKPATGGIVAIFWSLFGY